MVYYTDRFREVIGFTHKIVHIQVSEKVFHKFYQRILSAFIFLHSKLSFRYNPTRLQVIF